MSLLVPLPVDLDVRVGGLLWEPATDPAEGEDDGGDGTAGVLVPA